MAQGKYGVQYTCGDDCCREGCPRHIMTLTYQSCSNVVLINNGRGSSFGMCSGQADALARLIGKIIQFRSDMLTGFPKEQYNCENVFQMEIEDGKSIKEFPAHDALMILSEGGSIITEEEIKDCPSYKNVGRYKVNDISFIYFTHY